jgi:Domain of unknown function (DUF4145)
MNRWWTLGENNGYSGNELAIHRITCAFCGESGNFTTNYHIEKKDGSEDKTLNYDILQCVNCGNYTMVFWSGSTTSRLHDFKTVPWPTDTTKFPEHWPKDIGRYWVQAQRSLEGKNWDAAAVMARSAVQLALRYHNAVGKNLYQEIDDLAAKGLLPPVMRDWSHEVRELGNDSAHPTPASSTGTESKDAKDVVQFLSTLLQMLYDLPYKIDQYRARKES